MTTATATGQLSTHEPPKTQRRGRAAAIVALTRAETALLFRNRSALFNSLLLPILLVLFVYQLGGLEQPRVNTGALLITTMAIASLLFVTYYNLVATYVARREELVLKRMRTGEIGDLTILAGSAVPTVLVSVLQLAVVSIAVPFVADVKTPINVLLPAVAFVLGTVVFALLAAASTAFTRNSETAQITTLPVVMIGTALSGMFFPLSLLPDTLATVARFLPATPVVELFNLGLNGTTHDGSSVGVMDSFIEGLVPLGILVAWLVLAAVLAARFFRWEPRR